MTGLLVLLFYLRAVKLPTLTLTNMIWIYLGEITFNQVKGGGGRQLQLLMQHKW